MLESLNRREDDLTVSARYESKAPTFENDLPLSLRRATKFKTPLLKRGNRLSHPDMQRKCLRLKRGSALIMCFYSLLYECIHTKDHL